MEENLKSRKLERKEGITYYLCQHLEEGLMTFEDSIIWIGDQRRIILCPLCNKLEFGNQMIYYWSVRGLSEKKMIKLYKKFRDKVFKWVGDNMEAFTKHD